MTIKLPEPEYYSLPMLERKWNCPVDQILHYGWTGQLKISVISEGWYIEEYHFELLSSGEYGRVPDGYRRSYGDVLRVHPNSIREIITSAEVSDPLFVNEKNGNNICIDDYNFGSSGNFYNPDENVPKVRLNARHLVVTKEHLEQFEKSISSDIPPSIHTGDPGRPSSAHLYIREFEERARSDNLEKTLAEQARVLLEWFKEKHTNMPIPTLVTIENRIRETYNKFKKAPK